MATDSIKLFALVFILAGIIFLTGCSVERFLNSVALDPPGAKALSMKEEEKLFDKFYLIVVDTGKVRKDDKGLPALRQLPRDAYGMVNWTTAVMEGWLSPKGMLNKELEEEEALLNLNIFIEAKVPMMANVVFPHSIHTYWLSCNNCHPKIFIPEAGANPITMDEIFAGEWCGRCHGKVAFDFWPEANCRRCHMVPKKMSGRHENF